MKTVQYKRHNMAHNSEAYRLWETWKKTGSVEDQKKLDLHLREVEQRDKQLLERYK